MALYNFNNFIATRSIKNIDLFILLPVATSFFGWLNAKAYACEVWTGFETTLVSKEEEKCVFGRVERVILEREVRGWLEGLWGLFDYEF
jgi:hypothetical protein